VPPLKAGDVNPQGNVVTTRKRRRPYLPSNPFAFSVPRATIVEARASKSHNSYGNDVLTSYLKLKITIRVPERVLVLLFFC